jgi:hypothetical protein
MNFSPFSYTFFGPGKTLSVLLIFVVYRTGCPVISGCLSESLVIAIFVDKMVKNHSKY